MKFRMLSQCAVVLVLVLASLVAQKAPVMEFRELAIKGLAEPLRYGILLPKDFHPEFLYSLLFAMPGGAQDRAAVEKGLTERWARAYAGGYDRWIVVSPVCAGRERDLPALLTHLRQTFRIEGLGMHLAGFERAGASSAWRLAIAQSHEFRTVTVWPAALPDETAPLVRLHGRCARLFANVAEPGEGKAAADDAQTLRAHGIETSVVEVAKEPDPAMFGDYTYFPSLLGVVYGRVPNKDLADTLDAFHDAAAKGDEERYFAILPDDAVFLGTDATERWTGAEFRKFAMPYFQRGPAWTYVPIRRHITLAPDGKLAWFDEVLDNEAYGECRGSGVLELRGERWVIRQYNLTIPVPNDLARGLVARIRAFAEGKAPAVTTVVIVRHGEKGEGDDPELTEAGKARAASLAAMLGSLPVAAIYTSEYRRTAATVAPLCSSRKLEAQVVPAADAKGLAARIKKEHLGKTVVVAGHSNTVPLVLKALGVAEAVKIGDDEYDRLFVVTLGPDGARLLELHYGNR